ncbi:hypothetical protein BJV78DRAFT_1177590 [Lactifluus subvellereus]|nr:hypothetical protein BJV78DRAFT_1177590 [Lactifluus subvellereus]
MVSLVPDTGRQGIDPGLRDRLCNKQRHIRPAFEGSNYLPRFVHKLYVSLLPNPERSFSGITTAALEPITTTLADVQAHLRTMITP